MECDCAQVVYLKEIQRQCFVLSIGSTRCLEIRRCGQVILPETLTPLCHLFDLFGLMSLCVREVVPSQFNRCLFSV